MTPLDQQLQQMEAMARQHFPDDAERRNAYYVEKLIERLREFHARLAPLQVREMTKP